MRTFSGNAPDALATLLEREHEWAIAAGALERARSGEGRIVLIEGPPGIGKTALLAAVRSAAVEAGMTALKARAGEMERDLAYGVVRELLEPTLRRADPAEREALLEGAASLAVPVLGTATAAGRRRLAPGDAGDAQAVAYGLYWLVSNLAERSPLLITVDDVHWADPQSIGCLQYLARRVQDLPVVLALAARTAGPGKVVRDLARIAAQSGAQVLRPTPLSAGATASLVRSLLRADAEDEFCRACHAATAGNPFLVHELVRELQAEQVRPIPSDAARIREVAPEGVARAVFLRLSRVPAPAADLAQAAAVLGEKTELRHAAALAGLDEAQAGAAMDALIAADVLAPARPLSFAHPLVRQVIYQEMPLGERALAHARAASLLHDSDVGDDQVVSHLLVAEPNREPWRVETLRRAAETALASGVPGAAVTYLRRALAEPPSAAARGTVLAQLGIAEARAGDPAAVGTLRAALEHALGPTTRTRVALELGQATEMVRHDPAAAAAELDPLVADLHGVDPDLALRLEVEFIGAARLLPESRAAARERLARLAARDASPRAATAPLLANLALDALESGQTADAVRELAERALAGGWLLTEESLMMFSYAANAHTWSDHLGLAFRHWDRALAEAQRRGSAMWFLMASCWRSHLALRRGAIAEAEADARAGLDLSRQHELPLGVAYASAFLADALIETGQLSAASAVLAEADPALCPFLWDSRGRLHHHEGSCAKAFEDFAACERMLAGRGGRDCPGIIPWRSGAALARASLGDVEEARALVAEELRLAADQGAPRALGVALRAAGLVEGGGPGLDLLREAVRTLQASAAVLEHARALIDLGAATRRVGRRSEARDPLRRGLDLAHRCGATALAASARHELLATGARPRRLVLTGVDALTASERRVALLAAEGRTNRQIAQALFISMRTVAIHLSHAYQKLGISGREQLADALESDPDGNRMADGAAR